MNTNNKKATIAFASPWKTLTPYLQHTAAGDMVISNQFESLVGYNENGEFVPLGAKAWKSNFDFTRLEFEIDTSKKFSNGDELTAQDYKSSWENSMNQISKSTNNSLLDILYKIKGFEDFDKNQQISGIIASDKKTLVIEFKSSYRMALEFLTGSRFAAYKKVKNELIGTGIYNIQNINENYLKFISSTGKPDLDVKYVETQNLEEAILTGKIDAVHQVAYFNFTDKFYKNENISINFTNESRHKIILMNTKTGLFAKKENRKALQYLTTKYFLDKKITEHGSLVISPQYYISFQKGQINEKDARALIETYSVYVPTFMEEAKYNPPIVFENSGSPVLPVFEHYGIPVHSKSRVIKPTELFELIYHPKEHDILSASASVNSGDPDGLYHLLGEKGAISNPYSINKRVSKALEEGRKITDNQQLDVYYRKVTDILLDEIPVIHIGFGRNANIYRNDVVKLKSNIVRRNDGHLNIYELK